MILFAPEHFVVVEQQALLLLDEMDRVMMISDRPSKTAWLDIIAKSLGHESWDVLQENIRVAQDVSTAIFTPENLFTVGKAIRELLGDSSISLDDLEMLLISIGTSEEKASNGVDEHFSVAASDCIILELGPRYDYDLPLLEWLWPGWSMGRDVCEIEQRYAEHMKKKRSGLSKAEVKERHFDVYAKTGKKIRSILDSLLGGGYLEWTDDDQKKIQISNRGNTFICSMLTNEYSPEWQSWWQEFQSLYTQEPYKQLSSNWDEYIQYYSKGHTPAKAVQLASWGTVYTDSLKAVTGAIQKQSAIDELPLYPDQKFFMFFPRLLLDNDLPSLPLSDIEFEFNGPEWCQPPAEPILKRFWPNKRHMAISVLNHRGWYVSIPEGTTEFEVTYNWRSKTGAFRPVVHAMTYSLNDNQIEPRNWLYTVNAMRHMDVDMRLAGYPEYAFHSLRTLTSGEKLTQDEICALDRVQAGINRLEINETVTIIERRNIVASNAFECHQARW